MFVYIHVFCRRSKAFNYSAFKHIFITQRDRSVDSFDFLPLIVVTPNSFSNTTPPSANRTARCHWAPRQPLPANHQPSPSHRHPPMQPLPVNHQPSASHLQILTVNIPPRARAIFVGFNERKRLLTSLRRRGENSLAAINTDTIF